MHKGIKMDVRQGLFYGFIVLLTGCGGSGGGSVPVEPAIESAPSTVNAAESDRGGAATAAPAGSSQTTEETSGPQQSGPVFHPAGEWRSLGSSLSGGSAASLSMAVPEGIPHISWEESGKVYVAFWDGQTWQSTGPFNKDPSKPAFLPALSTDGRGLYLSWTESHTGDGAKSLHVMKKENGHWVDVASQAPDAETAGEGCWAGNADLALLQGVPVVAVDLFCSGTRYASTVVQEWAGTWSRSAPEGMMGHDAGDSFPRKYAVASGDADLYLAVLEGVQLEEMALKVYQKGDPRWTPIGGRVNDSTMLPSSFALKSIQGRPYLAFQEGGIRLKHWNGTEWVADGAIFPSTSEAPLTSPALAKHNGAPYLGYAGAMTEVWLLNETGWTRKGGALTRPGTFTSSLSLAVSGGTLYAAWTEGQNGMEGGSIQVKTIPVS